MAADGPLPVVAHRDHYNLAVRLRARHPAVRVGLGRGEVGSAHTAFEVAQRLRWTRQADGVLHYGTDG